MCKARSPLPNLNNLKRAIALFVYIDLDRMSKPCQIPQSPFLRGTSDPVPSFLRRVREDQSQPSPDQTACVYTVARFGRATLKSAPLLLNLGVDRRAWEAGVGECSLQEREGCFCIYARDLLNVYVGYGVSGFVLGRCISLLNHSTLIVKRPLCSHAVRYQIARTRQYSVEFS